MSRLKTDIRRAPAGGVAPLLKRFYSGSSGRGGVSRGVDRGPDRIEAPSPSDPDAKPSLRREELNVLERNPAFTGVSGSFRVDIAHSGRAETITAPQAAGLSAAVARALPPGALHDESVTEIIVVSDLGLVGSLQASPSGKALRQASPSAVVDADPESGFRRVYLLRDALDDAFRPKSRLPAAAFSAPEVEPRVVSLPVPGKRRLGPLLNGRSSMFVGGLISRSAEPPEGFFAASTWAELKKKGWRSKSAADADIWLYRVPDSRPESYFDFEFPSADRPAETPHDGKFKIASGIGPAHDPASRGGDEADLLWLGDEQHGALDAFLRILTKPDLRAEDLYGTKGFVQQLSPTEVVVGGIDNVHSLTLKGFEALETDPAIYRRIFSEDYDDYLLSLFDAREGPAAAKSYLLATSRGCGQGCAICCSGGLKRFQYFSGARMMRELEKIMAHARPEPGQVINVFFVDSNLNINPKRLIEFARLLEASPLKDRFRFYARHNSATGFLKGGSGGVKVPNHDLIRAYEILGIRQVVMGVDAYDDASVRTLKTNVAQLRRKGAGARPTYTYAELRGLIRAFEKHGLSTRGFYLINNPWIGDLDRVDSYFNKIIARHEAVMSLIGNDPGLLRELEPTLKKLRMIVSGYEPMFPEDKLAQKKEFEKASASLVKGLQQLGREAGIGLPERGRAPVIEGIARRLAEGPINSGAYGTEMFFMRGFSREARALYGTDAAGYLEAETRLLQDAAAWFERRGADLPKNYFRKNMAILADDLYLMAVHSDKAASLRPALARLRSFYGTSHVRRLSALETGGRERVREDKVPRKDVKGRIVAALSPGALGAALKKALRYIEARDLSILGFPSVTKRWALSPRLSGMLSEFYDRLARLNAASDAPAEASVWKLALEVTEGDPVPAAEMLGGIIGQTKRPLRYIERRVIPKHPEAAAAVPAFEKAAKAYFLLGMIHEKSLRRGKGSALYPRGVRLKSPKFWHYYAAAMLGHALRGFSRGTARLAGLMIAAGYEAVTLPVGLRFLPPKWKMHAAAAAVRSGVSDVRTQMLGHTLGRSWTERDAVSQRPVRGPPQSGVRVMLRRVKAFAQGVWWQYKWNIGPNVLKVWRRYQARLDEIRASGRVPAVKSPLGLFVQLRVMGFNGKFDPSRGGVVPDAELMTEARQLFNRYIRADAAGRAAFDRFIERAVRYNPAKRNLKLRSTLAYHLRDISVRPSAELPAYLDSLLTDGDALAEYQSKQGEILAAFKKLADKVIVETNRGAEPGRRALGFMVFGSFASGAPRPGSDLDLQVITEDGNPPADTSRIEGIIKEWGKLPFPVKLDLLSFTYVPADKYLLGRLHPEAYLVISPYPQVVKSLSRDKGGDRTPKALKSPRTMTGAALRLAAREVLRSSILVSELWAGARGLLGLGRRGPEALSFETGYDPELESRGWRIGAEVPKAVGFHKFYEAITPGGQRAFVVLHVNGRDRLTHMQSYFKLLGVSPDRVHSLEGFRSWKREYLATFKSLGYVPDAAVYGLTWSAVSAVLSRDPTLKKDSEEIREFWEHFTKPKAGEIPDNDIAYRPMKVLELADGRRIWFFLDLYGRLGGDLMEALLEHGVTDITAMGTAGSMDPDSKVGDWYTPGRTMGPDGKWREVPALKSIPGIPRNAGHTHVATPNVETKKWLRRAMELGVKSVEVELIHILKAFAKHPGARLHLAHVISDVMVGPNHVDLTETSPGRIPNEAENVARILEAVLDLPPGGELRVKSAKNLPFPSAQEE